MKYCSVGSTQKHTHTMNMSVHKASKKQAHQHYFTMLIPSPSLELVNLLCQYKNCKQVRTFDALEGVEGSYDCNNCGEEWCFFPDDFDWKMKDYPKMCILCHMPLYEFLQETYRAGGIREVLYMLRKRYLHA